jgi:hypothetical protein
MCHVLHHALAVVRVSRDCEVSGSRKLRIALLEQSRRHRHGAKDHERILGLLRRCKRELYEGYVEASEVSTVARVLDWMSREV